MNRVVELERARASVETYRRQCRDSYDRGGGTRMDHILFASWDFHLQCQHLREAEERVRLLEMRGVAANDTGPADVFDMNYPRARKTRDLLEALKETLPPIDHQRLSPEAVIAWDPEGDVFAEVAHWVRIENAHLCHQLRLPTPGMELPPRFPMPAALDRALSIKIERAKKTRKKAAS